MIFAANDPDGANDLACEVEVVSGSEFGNATLRYRNSTADREARSGFANGDGCILNKSIQ